MVYIMSHGPSSTSIFVSVSSIPITTFSILGVITAAFPSLEPPPTSINSILLTPLPIPLHIAAPTPAPASPAWTIRTSSSLTQTSSIPAALKLAFKSIGFYQLYM